MTDADRIRTIRQCLEQIKRAADGYQRLGGHPWAAKHSLWAQRAMSHLDALGRNLEDRDASDR